MLGILGSYVDLTPDQVGARIMVPSQYALPSTPFGDQLQVLSIRPAHVNELRHGEHSLLAHEGARVLVSHWVLGTFSGPKLDAICALHPKMFLNGGFTWPEHFHGFLDRDLFVLILDMM